MSVLVDARTRVLVQGITGREGRFHTQQMLAYGTKVVAGVTPGRGGQFVEEVPVFDSVEQAFSEQEPDAGIIFVPPSGATDAIIEQIDGGIGLIICITEGIPILDMVELYRYAREKGSRLIGPNCPGVISPGKTKIGIMPGTIFMPGPAGVVSRSGTLTYEVVAELTKRGLGQSTCVGIGGDPIIGSSFVDVLTLFEEDPETRMIVLIGEIGGNDEEKAADFMASNVTKPVVAFVAGKTAPPEKRMGHAGAIITAGQGTAGEKETALQRAGVTVASSSAELADLAAQLMASLGSGGSGALGPTHTLAGPCPSKTGDSDAVRRDN